jgi:UDP-glucose 4-epimerase
MALAAKTKALVTGGCGYMGARLVRTLVERGNDVVVWARAMPPSQSAEGHPPGAARIEAVDLSDATAMRALPPARFDYVFHLAGNTDFMGSVEYPYEDCLDNVVATVNVLEFIRRRSPKSCLIFTSSAHVYGEGNDVPISETMHCEPVSPYGASKLCAEHYVRLYARIYGLRTAIARLFPIYGPGLRRYVVFDFIQKLATDSSVLRIHGDGSQVRDLNYVDNVIDALTTIARAARFDGDVYNVASGTQVSIADLSALIAEAMHVAPRLEFSRKLATGAVARWIPDVSAIMELGYRSRVSLKDGLARTVAWFEADCGGNSPVAPKRESRS